MVQRSDNQQLLKTLAESGCDLTRPHHTTHYFLFKSEEAAQAAAVQLQAENMDVEVDAIPEPWWKRLFTTRDWMCMAETHAILSEAAVAAVTERFRSLAAQFDGEYDGWEAAVEPSDQATA